MQKWYRIFLLLKDAVRLEAVSTTMIQRDRRAITRDCYVNERGSGRLSTVMKTCVIRQFMVRDNIQGYYFYNIVLVQHFPILYG